MNKLLHICLHLFLVSIPIVSLFIGQDDNVIIWDIRIPTYLSAFSTGSLLALVGLSFQRVFRNDLAGPYTLGVSSGSSLGILIVSYIGIQSIWIGSLFGVIISLIILLGLIKFLKDKTSNTLILAGICLNILFSGLLVFLLFISEDLDLVNFIRWTMGNVQSYGLSLALPTIIVSIVILLGHIIRSKQYDALLLGDNIARLTSFDPLKFKTFQLILLSLGLGVCISIHGPVSFVGFVIPHMVKRFKLLNFNNEISDFKQLSVLVFLWGGNFLLLCEFLSTILPTALKLPVGVVTTLIGSILMIFILIYSEKTNTN